MPLKRRRSPQEKKALSYAKDRRNSYGENDKASRKNIPRSKARGHRSLRRRAASSLNRYEVLGEDEAALTENELVSDLDRKQRWQKSPDRPLSDHVTEQTARRQYRDGRKFWYKKNKTKAEAEGSVGFMSSWNSSEDKSFFVAMSQGVLKRS
ncbi:MAG: hypothetical protein AAFY19_05140 [Pseudomonadota bacterium]